VTTAHALHAVEAKPEQTRARYPDVEGYVEREGVRLFYEVCGEGEETVFLLPTWSIVHSRIWKGQIPYLARHLRVITHDGRGNGKSDRPEGADAYATREFVADALAVMDATGTERTALVSLSMASQRALILAAEHPDRVSRVVFISPSLPLTPGHPGRDFSFDEQLDTDEGWAKDNRHYWLRDYPGYLQFFFSQVFTEPHSTKQIEDCVSWGLETTPETLIATAEAPGPNKDELLELCSRIRCPVLVVHGDENQISPHARVEQHLRRPFGLPDLVE